MFLRGARPLHLVVTPSFKLRMWLSASHYPPPCNVMMACILLEASPSAPSVSLCVVGGERVSDRIRSATTPSNGLLLPSKIDASFLPRPRLRVHHEHNKPAVHIPRTSRTQITPHARFTSPPPSTPRHRATRPPLIKTEPAVAKKRQASGPRKPFPGRRSAARGGRRK